MTDKDIKDYCKDCKVEPSAMRIKCPECEHNPCKEGVVINNVDVQKCKYRFYPTFGLNSCCRLLYCDTDAELLCSDNPNCYFKQLARKTQECEKLKDKFKKFFGIDNQECWDIAFLKDENARYRKALEEIEEMAKTCSNQDVCTLCPYSDKCKNPYNARVYEPSRSILDIINKARGERNE